jgi:hypothetical protein
MKRLTVLFLLVWLAGCVVVPVRTKAIPPGHQRRDVVIVPAPAKKVPPGHQRREVVIVPAPAKKIPPGHQRREVVVVPAVTKKVPPGHQRREVVVVPTPPPDRQRREVVVVPTPPPDRQRREVVAVPAPAPEPEPTKAPPPGHRPGGLHPSKVAELRNHVKHGYKNLRQGDCDAAREEFKLALEIDPFDAEAKAGWKEAASCRPKGNVKANRR